MTRREAGGWGLGARVGFMVMAAVLAGCSAGAGAAGDGWEDVEQAASACSYTVTTNTYVGSDYWGTLTFRNTGTQAMTSPRIAFTVPSGVTCDYDASGWSHTQSGTTCTYARTSSLTVAANASYTFNYSTDSNASFTAGNVVISDPSCTSGGTDAGTGGGTDAGTGDMTASQKSVAEGLTSIWENDTPKLAYAYAENIHDGRGYTSGRAGFCTGTGDAILVIQCYDALRSASNGNLMAKYMPGLTTINNRFESTGQDQASTAELDSVGNWVSDWAASYNTAATQADFKSCQDKIVDQLYYTPAMNAARKWGLTKALSKAEIYDAFINHGEDGVLTMIKATNSALGDSAQVAPSIGYNGITESAWLQKFLEKRRDTLYGDSTWRDSVDRVAAYEKARRRGNWDFATAISNDVRARDCWGTTYPSSGYTVRQINPDGTWTTPSSPTYSCN